MGLDVFYASLVGYGGCGGGDVAGEEDGVDVEGAELGDGGGGGGAELVGGVEDGFEVVVEEEVERGGV